MGMLQRLLRSSKGFLNQTAETEWEAGEGQERALHSEPGAQAPKQTQKFVPRRGGTLERGHSIQRKRNKRRKKQLEGTPNSVFDFVDTKFSEDKMALFMI